MKLLDESLDEKCLKDTLHTTSSMKANIYSQRLLEIEQILSSKRYTACVRECGFVFESALRDIVQHLMTDLEDAAKRDEIIVAERKLAKGNESFKKFGLGQLVGLFMEGKLFEKFKAHLGKPLPKLRRISWNDVVSLRNEATHDDANADLDEADALQMFHWLKLFLYETQLVGESDHHQGSKSGGQQGDVATGFTCSECKAPMLNDWKFCPFCGTCAKRVCAGCGENLSPKFKICPYCETPLRDTTSASLKAKLEYEMLFRGAFLDKFINDHEREMLEQKRLELGLTIDEIEDIENQCIPRNEAEYHRIVEAVLVDGVITENERIFLNQKIDALKISPQMAAMIEHGALMSRESILPKN